MIDVIATVTAKIHRLFYVFLLEKFHPTKILKLIPPE